MKISQEINEMQEKLDLSNEDLAYLALDFIVNEGLSKIFAEDLKKFIGKPYLEIIGSKNDN